MGTLGVNRLKNSNNFSKKTFAYFKFFYYTGNAGYLSQYWLKHLIDFPPSFIEVNLILSVVNDEQLELIERDTGLISNKKMQSPSYLKKSLFL